jgi:4-hydroxymandelate oxidase
MTRKGFSRRKALAAFGSIIAASPLRAQQQTLLRKPPGHIPPLTDLVNLFEFDAVAERRLAESAYSLIAGGDRSFFERITFRPRMMVSTTDLDLSQELFGEKMFAPILVGPMSHQQTFHPDGELAVVRAAAAAKAAVVVSCDSSYPIERIADEAKTPLWYQVYPEADMKAVRSRAQQAVRAGCKVVCLTVGMPYRSASAVNAWEPARLATMANPPVNWEAVGQLREELGVPLILKGIMSPKEADNAVKRGVHGIIVSNYRGLLAKGLASPIEMLPSITEAVSGRIPVLVDGGFRRGTDVMKALAFGARGVLVGRPTLWGLAAYGSDGVQTVLEMLQTELGSTMCQCGKANLKAIDRTVVKIHRV